MSKTILKEIESLRQIIVCNKPVESIEEREGIISKMKNVKELSKSSDKESFNIINNGVAALENAVDAFLNLTKNKNVGEEVVQPEEEVLPEIARPFQPIAFDQRKPLAIHEALAYFDHEDKAITEMPFKPKSGEVILFKAKSAKHMNDWRSTGQRWYQCNGGSSCMKGLMKRKVANIVTPSSGKNGVSTFQRISWTHREKPMFTLIQYVGDDSVSVDFPHKNSKKDIPYIRSAPSVLRDLEVGTKKPFQIYQELVFNAPTDATSQNLLVPRNTTQVRNCRQRFRKEKKGTDSLTNLVRLGLEYEDMRLLIVTPDIILVSITPEMLKQVREILKVDYDTARNKVLLGYDTQFDLGDYYVSWITIRDIRYVDKKSGKCPVLPAIQVIHERKLALHHKIAWEVIVDLIPEIKTRKLVATSDDEFTPLLKRFVQTGLVSKFEIHGVKKIERWISKHGGNKVDGQVLKSDFR